MSTLETNLIQPATGTALTVGASGDTITVPSGATFNVAGTLQSGGAAVVNTPAFEAYLSSRQTISTATDTKVQFDTERFDTAGEYDNSTNYRFTPTISGKYFVYSNLGLGAGDNDALGIANIYIYLNGALYFEGRNDNSNNSQNQKFVSITSTLVMNGTSDYIEIYGRVNTSSGTPYFEGGSTDGSNFGAYKIIE
jgi:hypothetical protein